MASMFAIRAQLVEDFYFIIAPPLHDFAQLHTEQQ
jgi:hypothetical protein